MTTTSPIRIGSWIGKLLLLATACLISIGCHELSDAEKKIVGVWEFTGIDATGRLVYRSDHMVVELFPEYDALNSRWVPRSRGSWRLEGNDIVSKMDAFPIPGMPPIPSRLSVTSIREFHEHRLVREEGRSDLVRITSNAEMYRQALALIYVGVSVVGLLAAIHGIRKSPFRREFILIALAGLLALVWSASTLIDAFAQVGQIIISASSLRALRLPAEILGIVGVVTFIVGFARLAYRLER